LKNKHKIVNPPAAGLNKRFRGFGEGVKSKDLGTCLLKNRGASFSPFGYSKFLKNVIINPT
jgi:hypothetical protein